MKKYLHKNLLFCLIFISSISNYSFAQTANNSIDATGDIAFTAYLTNAANGIAAFSFVLLDNCPNNQSIGFTDEEWTGSSFLPLGEGEVIWTNNTGVTIPKGTVIKIAGPAGLTVWTNANASASTGNIAVSGSLNTANGDQLFAMTGNRNSHGTLLAFVGGIGVSTLVFQGTPFGSGGNPTSNLVFNGTYATNLTAGSAFTATPSCNGTIAQCNVTINTAASWSSPGTFANAAAFFANTPIPNSFTGSALPIELTRFEGNQKGGYNHLTWQTATESQNKGFDVERSTDGKTFRSIGFVEGKGNSTNVSNYSFTDEKPYEGVNYYRLKQNDFDGRFEYSHILSIENKTKEDRFVVFPNPVSEVLNVAYLGKNNDLRSIEIYDVFGKLILQVSNDLQETEINTSNLQSGTYIWKINQNGNIQSGKFVKM